MAIHFMKGTGGIMTDNGNSAIKQRNRVALLTVLYEGSPATKQDIARRVNLSLPTITSNLKELEERGLVVRADLQESTGGRKPQTFAFNAQHCVAIGVQTAPTRVSMLAVDLHGGTLTERERSIPWSSGASYWRRIGTAVNEFAGAIEASGSHVLGVAVCDAASGAAANGNGSPASGTAASATASNTAAAEPGTEALEILSRETSRSCTAMAPQEAEAMAELWHDPTVGDAAYLSIGREISCALVLGGALHRPQGAAGRPLGHMTLVPGGRQCACGNRGCVNAYCSLPSLPEDGESLAGFFSVLEQGEPHHRQRMGEWLDHLAQVVTNIRTVIPVDVIIGGAAASYLDDADIGALRTRVGRIERRGDDAAPARIRKCLAMDSQGALGAGMMLVREYLDHPYKICQ